ncbi:MAG: hypothetical protein ACI4U2_05745, partial [Christensenellaceae bacterium]
MRKEILKKCKKVLKSSKKYDILYAVIIRGFSRSRGSRQSIIGGINHAIFTRCAENGLRSEGSQTR